MARKAYSITEQKVIDIFCSNRGRKIEYQSNILEIGSLVGKPRPNKGECKTDCYVELKEPITGRIVEPIKISIKQPNADFTGNKTNAETAECELGEKWSAIIKNHTEKLAQSFLDRQLIFFEKSGKTESGSITLGWKFEFMNKKSGELSDRIGINIADHYTGNSLPESKKDSMINGHKVKDSGIANCMLTCSETEVDSLQGIINRLETIEVYSKKNPYIYFACKALNCRTLHEKPFKYDGPRPLAVQVFWDAFKDSNSIRPLICFDSPLVKKGDLVRNELINSLSVLACRNTNDLKSKSVNVLPPLIGRCTW